MPQLYYKLVHANAFWTGVSLRGLGPGNPACELTCFRLPWTTIVVGQRAWTLVRTAVVGGVHGNSDLTLTTTHARTFWRLTIPHSPRPCNSGRAPRWRNLLPVYWTAQALKSLTAFCLVDVVVPLPDALFPAAVPDLLLWRAYHSALFCYSLLNPTVAS